MTTHFDYHSISNRLIKLDILGHDDPTVIRMLEEVTGVDVNAVPFDDPAVLALFSGVSSLGLEPEELGTDIGSRGLPEFGTRFVRQMLHETQPRTFSELVRISGLSHGTAVWLTNARELIRDRTAALSQVIATRDDIMTNLIHWGMEPSLAFHIMEKVRKGRGITAEEEQAVRVCGSPDWYVESCQKNLCWWVIRAAPGDCAAEARGAEATPKEKNLLTILEVALEMTLRGIEFVPVDLSSSAAEAFELVETVPGKRDLLCPFVSVQGLGIRAAQSIVKARAEQPFTSHLKIW